MSPVTVNVQPLDVQGIMSLLRETWCVGINVDTFAFIRTASTQVTLT